MDTTFDDEPTLYWIIRVNDNYKLVWHQAYPDARSRAVAFAAMMHDEGFIEDFTYEQDFEDTYAGSGNVTFYPFPDGAADGSFWDEWVYGVLNTLYDIYDTVDFAIWLKDEPAPQFLQTCSGASVLSADDLQRIENQSEPCLNFVEDFVEAVRAMIRPPQPEDQSADLGDSLC